MSKFRFLTSVTVILLGLLVYRAAMSVDESDQNNGQKGWDAVKAAMNKGLPKTAVEHLDPIAERALEEKAYAEAIRAISMKVLLEGTIQGNKPEEKITRMRTAIDAAPAPMKPVMEAIQANWYWHYFQQNRWRFQNRTQTADSPSEDFTTWSLPRILDEIDNQFDKAFEGSDVLKDASVEDYAMLLDKGTAPASYRPTIFDVIAHNALEFYSAGEHGAARPQDAFDLMADSPIFADRDAFVAWKPDTTDTDSLLLRAIGLQQELLLFHADDEDRSALLDADLLRLVFGYDHAFGEEKTQRFKSALKRFEQEHSTHPISSRALHELAQVIHGEEDFIEAHKLASTGLARHPDSIGANRCYNLIQQIEAPSASVSTERVWTDPPATIDVQYRNVTKMYFRIVPFDFEDFINSGRWSPEQLDQKARDRVLTTDSIKSWEVELPETEDYKQRVESQPIPQGLAAGSYYLLASHRQDFRKENNQLSLCEVWVSDLALVSRSKHSDGIMQGFVLEAESGEPIRGATVRAWQRDNRSKLFEIRSVKTDKNGMYRFPAARRRQAMLLVSHGKHSLSSANYLNTYHNNRRERETRQTRFFTDRSIYRPGQTIHYKGICLSVDHRTDDYKTIPRTSVTVVFYDPNGKEIERVKHATNSHGSFSGSVTAPRDRLMGRMRLSVEGGPNGQTNFRVEEYKRPKFQVKIDAPNGEFKLGDEVTTPGKATAYTGAAINDAKVSWRVVRQVQYPIWWYWRCWWMPPQPGQSQEIAHGTSATKADGSFEVKFVANADESVDRSSEPTFRYTVYADVTDTTGETRSDQRTISLGYTTLKATMTAENWLANKEPVDIAIRTTTLDGEGRSASGKVKIFSLESPKKVIRPAISGRRRPVPYRDDDADTKAPPTSDPISWPLGDLVAEHEFTTDPAGNATVQQKLDAGLFRAVLSTRDKFGTEVSALLPIRVLNPKAKKLNFKLPELLAIEKDSVEPGETFTAIWGSGYGKARTFVEIEHRGEIVQSYWTEEGRTQHGISQDVTEAMRGGFTLRTTMVRENRAYMNSRQVTVPWSNKKLSIKWEHFVSKLAPAQKETWTAIISGPDSERKAAEMVATLYDASLDAFAPHDWPGGFGVFRSDQNYLNAQFSNTDKNLQIFWNNWRSSRRNATLRYPRLASELTQNFQGYGFANRRMRRSATAFGAVAESDADMMMADAAPAPMAAMQMDEEDAARSPKKSALGLEKAKSELAGGEGRDDDESGGSDAKQVDLESVSARKNLNETAFFFPHLVAEADGTVKIEFTMPEALTEWKFMGFAHDEQLRGGLLTDKAVTSKDLMVQPNAPRFLREGDEVEFTVKVSNQSPTRQTGTVRLTLADARTGDSVDEQLGNAVRDQEFRVAAGESKSYSWRLNVPDDIGFLTYKAVGSSGRLSDGEEGYLPVLSRRILVTESMAMPIRGPETKNFDFKRLADSAKSQSIKHQSLTVQMVSNPSWYAVMALPYLMEYPHQCSEQVFNRLYANALAKHIASSDPKIERIFEQWRGTPALDSPMVKNQDLKAVMIEETPWYRQAQSESQSRRNVGILFDQNRLDIELKQALHTLSEQQRDDGAWPWFPGGPANEYITLYIATGFGRMRHLGLDVDTSAAIKSLSHLDAWMTERYERISPADRKKNHLTTTIALYLYGRSFFMQDQGIAPQHAEAFAYWKSQAQKFWLDLANRQSQAHMALALKRLGDVKTAKAIMRSIKERSVNDDELGMFWRDTEQSWWWYRAPIETQAVMIEAFDEVMDDAAAVEDCKVWLLKQKQTQDWKTTKATADAIYALLLRGSQLLASDALVEVSLGGKMIKPENAEAGTGFYEQRFTRGEIKPNLSKVKVTKVDQGVAWGSVHWQYFEDIGKVTAFEGTPLKLTKQLYVKKNTGAGPTLERVSGPVEVGDELVVRIVLKTDRSMEYVHLKDHRGSGTEPVNVLSRYKYQDGLAYYESTRDTASHFFIDYLPKGTYVFEYSTRVQLKGKYQTGMAAIQCMYAPEFNSHSESLEIAVE